MERENPKVYSFELYVSVPFNGSIQIKGVDKMLNEEAYSDPIRLEIVDVGNPVP